MKLSGVTLLMLVVCRMAEAFAAEPPITAVAFSSDGTSVVATSQSGLQVYSWPDLKRERTIECSAANLHCVAFSPTGEHVAVGGGNPSEDGSVEIFSWPAAERVVLLGSHHDSVRAVAWQSSTRILSAGFDREIRLRGIGITPSNQLSIPRQSGSESPTVAVEARPENGQTLSGHSRSISSLCLLNDGKILVSASDDHSLRVWDLDQGELTRSLNQHTGSVHDLTQRPSDGALPMVASAAADRTIRFWQPTIGRLVRYVRLESEPLCIAWLDEDHIVAGCVDGRIRTVDANNVMVTDDQAAMDGWAYAIAVHPRDGSVAVAGTDGQIRRVKLRPTDDHSRK